MMEIYADYAAAAPLRPEARAAVLEALDAGLGNPSSAHDAGARARARLEAAREEVAAALGAHPLEVIFTSGATEANNLALAGRAIWVRTERATWAGAERVTTARADRAMSARDLHLAVPASEHASILMPARALATAGHRLTILPTDANGRTSAEAVDGAAADLLSVALVNAETGVVQDVAALAAGARAHGGLVHTDAAQAAAWMALDVDALGVDLLTLASTKLGGPAGAGALYVRRGTALAPLHHGGPHEQGLRAGTENVAAIVGFATALALAVAERDQTATRVAALRDRLRTGLLEVWPGARATLAADVAAAPHVVSLVLPGVVGEDVVAALDLEGVAASTGSACAAGAAEPSHVLVAMGCTDTEARSSLRLSLGWASSTADIDIIIHALGRVRARAARRSEEAAWPVLES